MAFIKQRHAPWPHVLYIFYLYIPCAPWPHVHGHRYGESSTPDCTAAVENTILLVKPPF